jgi:hypothetical protein
MTVLHEAALRSLPRELPAHSTSHYQVSRVVAVTALAALIVVHVPVAVQHIREVPYLGVAFYAFVLGAAALLGSLVERSRTTTWCCVLVGAGLALVTYVISRSVGLPGASDDVGDWGNTLGLISVGSELVLLITAGHVLLRMHRKR